jgi:hypothetical protein
MSSEAVSVSGDNLDKPWASKVLSRTADPAVIRAALESLPVT